MNREENQYVQTVVDGFSDTRGCLEFLVTFNNYNFDLLPQAVEKALGKDGYNDFSAKRFVTAFEKIKDKLFRVRFGREYSPVVYLVLKHDSTPEDIDAVSKAFSRTKFDERYITKDAIYNNCPMIRIWWD
jgi:hypothetical protein